MSRRASIAKVALWAVAAAVGAYLGYKIAEARDGSGLAGLSVIVGAVLVATILAILIVIAVIAARQSGGRGRTTAWTMTLASLLLVAGLAIGWSIKPPGLGDRPSVVREARGTMNLSWAGTDASERNVASTLSASRQSRSISAARTSPSRTHLSGGNPMRHPSLPVAITLISTLCVVACTPTSTPASHAPSSITPRPSPTASLADGRTESPASSPASAPIDLPIRASARENSDHMVLTAPGLSPGSLYVLISMRAAPAILALLDANGKPERGWPITVPDATACTHLLPVRGGTVRLVCRMENPDGDMFAPIGAYTFGRPMAGWPFVLDGSFHTAQVIGDLLVVYVSRSLGDVTPDAEPSFDSGLVTITEDGRRTDGVRVTDSGHCCMWQVGPDGVVAYGVDPATSDPSSQARQGSITALDVHGQRPGWPVSFEGVASAPTIAADQRALVVAASPDQVTSRVFAFDRAGGAPADVSLGLPLTTVSFGGDTGGCSPSIPQAPVVAHDGTIYVYGELENAIFALDPDLSVKAGWPYRSPQAFVEARPGVASEHEAGYCPPPVVPATGRDGSLFLPLQAASAGVGGSLVALDPDGRMRPGWPVTLERPGAEFWSVVVDEDGTAFAVAFEPERGDESSATIVAIAPDSTVRYTTTIIEP